MVGKMARIEFEWESKEMSMVATGTPQSYSSRGRFKGNVERINGDFKA